MLFSYDIFSCACLSSQSHSISRTGFLSISITGHASGVSVCTGPLMTDCTHKRLLETWAVNHEPGANLIHGPVWKSVWEHLPSQGQRAVMVCAAIVAVAVLRTFPSCKDIWLGRSKLCGAGLSQTVCSLPVLLGFPIHLVGAPLLTPAAPDPDTAPLASCPLNWHTSARATLAGYAPGTATTAGLTLTKR